PLVMLRTGFGALPCDFSQLWYTASVTPYMVLPPGSFGWFDHPPSHLAVTAWHFSKLPRAISMPVVFVVNILVAFYDKHCKIIWRQRRSRAFLVAVTLYTFTRACCNGQ